MGDRRRNLLILLAVGALLAGSLVVLLTKKTRLGLDLKGGVELVYQGRPTPQQPKVDSQSVDRAIDIMRKRVDALGVSEPEIQRTGADQIAVGLPGTKNAQRAIKSVGRVAQLFFYDSVTRAAKRPPTNQGRASVNGQYFLVSDQQRKVLEGPAETPGDLVSELPGGEAPRGTRAVKVNTGTLVVQAEAPTKPDGKKGKRPDRYFVINDAPALSGKELTNIRQDLQPQTKAPIVTFDFTDRGRSAWHNVTRTIAQRGQQLQAPGEESPPGQAPPSSQHFAAVLDGQLITVPYINFKEN